MPDQNSFFDDFLNELVAANLQAQGNLSVIEFANRILFNNDPAFKLYPTQQAILKAFYGESLTEEEKEILDGWVKEERSTWVEGRQYISLVMEAGRRASKCNSVSAFIPTTIGDISYGELHERLSNGEKIGIQTYNLREPVCSSYITYDIKSELNKIEQTYILKTYNGKEEITNKNHPFLVWDKDKSRPSWKKLKNIKRNDWIATSKSVPLFGSIDYEYDELRLYAFMLSSTYTDKPGEINFGIYISHDEVRYILDEQLVEDVDYILKGSKCTFISPKYESIRSKLDKRFIGSLSKESLRTLLKEIFTFSCNLKPLMAPEIPKRYKGDFKLYFYTNKLQSFICNQASKFGVCMFYKRPFIHLVRSSTMQEFVSEFGWDIHPSLKEEFTKNRTINCLDNNLPQGLCLSYEMGNKCTKHDAVELAKEINDPYLYDIGTNNIVWEKVKSIESYKIEQTIALEVADTHVIGSYIISHNSTMASIICLKEFYDLIIMENPHKHYGMFAGSPIAILVMAQSQAQVKETIFAAIKGYAEKSNFFMALKNKGEIEILTEEIRCPSKNIAIYAKHTNSKSLVGYTLKCMLLDEVARFETTGEEGKNKAFEIWRNVAAGGAAFGTDFKKVAISSAWEPGDPIEKFYEQAKEDSSALGFKLTTFQVNLQLKKGVTPVIVSDYKQDYVKARLEYEGVRFSKFNSFIDLENLQKCATGISAIDAQPCELDISSAAGNRYYAGVDIIRIASNTDPSNLSFVHVDPALKKDSAALAIARPQKVNDTWKIQIDALLKWEPRTDNKGMKRIVSYIDIEEKLDIICKERCVKRVTFDQWNSASFIQNLHAKGVDAQQVSCSREMQFSYYTLFRDLLNHDYIILPRDSLWSKDAITELSELVLKPNRQIIHPYAGKDIADAIVNSIYQCHQYMIMSGLNMKFGLQTGVAQSQRLSSVQRLNMGGQKVVIGNAIDKLHNRRNR